MNESRLLKKRLIEKICKRGIGDCVVKGSTKRNLQVFRKSRNLRKFCVGWKNSLLNSSNVQMPGKFKN